MERSESGSRKIITDPHPDPGGPKTYKSRTLLSTPRY